MYERYEGLNVRIFEIGSNMNDLNEFVQVFDTRFPGLFDAGNIQYGTYVTPDMEAPYPKDFIVDQEGYIAYWSEQYDPQEIMRVIDRLIDYQVPVEDEHGSMSLPKDYLLGQNYPNPFNPTTTISFSLASDEFVKLDVYDVMGKQVEADLFSPPLQLRYPAGNHEVHFDGEGLGSGIYIYRLQAGDIRLAKKMVLLK